VEQIGICPAADLKWSMEPPKLPSGKVLPFALPEASIEAQLEAWVDGIKESNDQLVAALERLRDSYKAMMAGGSVTDAEEILVVVEAALKNARRAKNVV
jgi:hypothetical protein